MIGSERDMRLLRLVVTLMAITIACSMMAGAARAKAPALDLQVGAADSIKAGETAPVSFEIQNSGDAPLNGQLTMKETVSPGLKLPGLPSFGMTTQNKGYLTGEQCQQASLSITCELTVNIPPGVVIRFTEPQQMEVDSQAAGALTVAFEVSGSGAISVSEQRTMTVGSLPYGIGHWRGALLERDGSPSRQSGATPDRFVNELRPVTTTTHVQVQAVSPLEQLKDAVVHLPLGLAGNPHAVPTCSFAQLSKYLTNTPDCPHDTQVGVYKGTFGGAGVVVPVYNMEPALGSPARFAFNYQGVIVQLLAHLRRDDYGIDVTSLNTNTTLVITSAKFHFWGTPADSSHDGVRGACLNTGGATGGNGELCPVNAPRVSFLRTPTRCTGEPLPMSIETNTYLHPEVIHKASFDLAPMTGCEKIPFEPKLEAQSTARSAQTPTGLSAKVEVPNSSFTNPEAISESDVKEVEVALPDGMTINPSQAEGLGSCSRSQYESTELSFRPTGKGCPSDSKIGTVQVKTPVLEETIPGDVYIATPFDNQFNSLLALYVVLEEPNRGILVKLAGKVSTDPVTGQITTTFSNLPQLPFSSFDFKLREGARAPLVTPAACGSYETTAKFTPWANPDKRLVSKSSIEVTSGIGGGPCPTGGLPPFKPLLQAGTINNAAGSYSPFNVRLARTDAEQEFTNFSIKLPPGLTGKLAGVPFCPDAAIEAARHRSGADELASASCPQASEIGRTLAGAGVGPVQTYVPGKIYLAGPYNGSALSIASVTAAKVGPFDLGTVVVRLALRIDPITAEVFVDATGSDPIPHIIDGVTTHIRDIRAYVDRPDFTLNPTSCKPTSTASTVLGSGLDFASTHDDEPVVVSTRFQAADCAALGFKPKLSLRLIGGTKRGDHPKLRANLRMRKGEANIAKAQVTLPRSAFLDQSHIGTVCTRVQYAKDACPQRSIYGYAKAITPLLDEPIQGPVYLRSSENKLPDLVAALRSGKIEIDLSGRIDSFGEGRIRSSFETVPDAPVSSFVLTMLGGKKGLIVNSANLCRGKHRAIVAFDAHNGKVSDTNPVVRAKCGKGRKKGR